MTVKENDLGKILLEKKKNISPSKFVECLFMGIFNCNVMKGTDHSHENCQMWLALPLVGNY